MSEQRFHPDGRPLVMGGHALVLKVVPTKALVTAAIEWCLQKPDVRKPKIDDAHVTMLFLGRDRLQEEGDKIIEAASTGERPMPVWMRTTGRLAMFGGKRDTLVALIEPENYSSKLRGELMQQLSRVGLGIAMYQKNHWGPSWTPHVTLAVGEMNAPNLDERHWPDKQDLCVTGLVAKLGSSRIHHVVRSL